MHDRQETSQHWWLQVHLAWWCSQSVNVGLRSWSLPGSSNDITRPRKSDGEFVLLPTTMNQIHLTLTSDIYSSPTHEQFHHFVSWLLQQHFSWCVQHVKIVVCRQYSSLQHDSYMVAPGTTTSQISSETDCTGYQFNIVSVSSVQCLSTERYMASLLHTSPDSVSNNPSSSVATSWDPRLLLHMTWLFQQRKLSLEDSPSLSPFYWYGTLCRTSSRMPSCWIFLSHTQDAFYWSGTLCRTSSRMLSHWIFLSHTQDAFYWSGTLCRTSSRMPSCWIFLSHTQDAFFRKSYSVWNFIDFNLNCAQGAIKLSS